ncbi:hypothetical protein FRC00_005252 [Tulasnella sp. 408]|nr:hypothetical protein FRC00_005252 [Tulasnella sp. 408]
MDAVVASAPKPTQGLSLLDMDENAEEEGVLPAKFSELDDSHFPLFVTYDQLCKLLEADFNLEFNPSPLPPARTARAKNRKISSRQPLISFDYFNSKIWPHMDHKVKRGLHSALVYSEFMGIIKGSEASLGKPRHYIDRSEYQNHNNRSLSGDIPERSRVYTLFEAYRKLRPSTSYDIADRVHLLIKTIQDHGVPGNHIDFLYVDEAQDNLIIDAALLRTLCPNPHGLFFAGDTAQTISVGSAFRFSELKAFLYRLERDDGHVKRGGRPPVDPHFFQLSTNYRSHGGIVNAAAFIVSLLDSYFQHSIDSLAPEVAHVDVTTHKPLFFSGMKNQLDFLRLISDSDSGKVELGAHQVIIVRNEKAASALKAVIGRVGVVLTLYESKGMEFNDVLLYNFFTDSPAAWTDWRAMLFAKRENKSFNARRHSILQSELKSFYVGLTRARERVWIWDETSDGYDMETLLVSHNLATSYKTGGVVPQLAATSVADEWSEQAKEYFSKGLFLEAELCFRKAEMGWWAEVAQAYDHRQEAMRLPEKQADRLSIFFQVAWTFDRLAQKADPNEDHESIRLLFYNAADCYTVIPYHGSAALAFLRAGKYNQAAYHYRMAGMFDEAVEVVKLHNVDRELAESVTYTAKFVFAARKDVPSLHKAWKLCTDKEEFLEFLQDNGFEEQRVDFLDSIGDYEEAAELLWESGGYVSAVNRFRQARSPSARLKATACLLDGIRAEIPFATGYLNPSDNLSELFSLIDDSEMSADEAAEVGMLRAVICLQTQDLGQYSRDYFEAGNIRCALLALDAWTQTEAPGTIEYGPTNHVAKVLLLCQQYGSVINFIVRDPDFIDHPDMLTLFGISSTEQAVESESQDITYQRTVQPRSFIFAKASILKTRDSKPRNQLDPITLSKNEVDDLIRRTLLERLNALIEKVDNLSRKSRRFEICPQFLMTKACPGHADKTCWRDHIPEKELNIKQFNSRFRLHLLSIAFVDYWTAIDGSVDEERNRANKQKYIAVAYILLVQAMPTVKSWLQEVFRSLRPGEQPMSFLTDLLTTCLLATAFDYDDAVTYLWRGQWSLDQSEAEENGLIIQGRDKLPVVGTAIHCYLLTGRAWIEVGVVVAFAEEICGQLIITEYYHSPSAYDGLTLPRSWIIRAFAREPSLQNNGALAFHFVSAISKFLKLLVLKEDPGRLQMQGKLVKEAAPSARGRAVARLCRCLALIGHNIESTKWIILHILKEIGTVANPQVRTEYQGYATACNWNEVVMALKTSSATSPLDKLIVVRQKAKALPSVVAGMRTIFCPDEGKLLKKLQLVDSPPTIALQSQTLIPGLRQVASNPGIELKPQQSDAALEQKSLQLERKSYPRNTASVIQAFFRRHRRRAGGPIARAFEDLAKKMAEDPDGQPPSRYLLLCVRGPLPHVLAYLNRLPDACLTRIRTLTKEMQDSEHEMIEELREKKDDVRSIHWDVERLIKDLHPSSKLYCRGPLKHQVSVSDIVARVQEIPNLVTRIHEFAECPEDADYDLGVEPLLSERVPWAPKTKDGDDEASPLVEPSENSAP